MSKKLLGDKVFDWLMKKNGRVVIGLSCKGWWYGYRVYSFANMPIKYPLKLSRKTTAKRFLAQGVDELRKRYPEIPNADGKRIYTTDDFAKAEFWTVRRVKP